MRCFCPPWRAADLGAPATRTEGFAITGDVGAAVFPGWILRHAGRLGLLASVQAQRADLVEVTVSGPPDLLDAMALGCSLGPQEVMVDQVLRKPKNPAEPSDSA